MKMLIAIVALNVASRIKIMQPLNRMVGIFAEYNNNYLTLPPTVG